uniref:Uncharacterized protein n=1 Tax=Davidia involucrata TaxID=16924 RepID=A0A5B6Z4E7_DAVIN
MEGINYNRGRGGGGRGRGGRRGGDQNQQYHQGGGRGGPTGAAAANQPPAQQLGNRQTGVYRPPSLRGLRPTIPESGESSGRGGDGRGVGGRGAWCGSGRAACVPDQPQRAPEPLPGGEQHQQYHQGGGGGRGGPTYAVAISRRPAQQSGNRPDYGQKECYRPSANQGVGPTKLDSGKGSGIGGGAWVGSSGARAPAFVPDQLQRAPEPLPDAIPDVQSLKISEQPHPSSPLGSIDKNLMPVERPDRGGTKSIRTVNLLVNHFPVEFNPEAIIIHYDVDIKSEIPPKGRFGKIPKSSLRMIWDKLCSDDPTRFPSSKTAYDGEKNIFSAFPLPIGNFKVELSDGENMRSRLYIVTLKHVNELNLCKLKDYLSGNLLSIPRDILQGMDVVMKENPSRRRISVGRSSYSTKCNQEDGLGRGITASRGFQQSLKPTSKGLSLALDYSVLAFLKPLPVIDFLKEHIRGFSTSDFRRWRREVMNVLKGLQVTVTHRVTKQKYTIAGLTDKNTSNISFDVEDPEGKDPPKTTPLVAFFRDKYGKDIIYKDIPCLDLGKNNRKNDVPMEFCILVEGQRYPKENLDRDAARELKGMSMALPKDRKNRICEMLQAKDGPCGGDTIQNFDMPVVKNMATVAGRVLEPPKLKLRDSKGKMIVSSVDKDKCQWNLAGKSVLEGKPVERWALLDFSSSDRCKLIPNNFIQNLKKHCKNLGIHMDDPLVRRFTKMSDFKDVTELHQFLEHVIEEANEKGKGRLQIIVCVITKTDPVFDYLKWISETQIGILTQCCLSTTANKGNPADFVNLAIKINAKLGGSNVELNEWLPRFKSGGHVMFVGADVNHPGPGNFTSPSIAAVVASVNWPAANRYAARVCPQDHRKENILNFGSMCLDLLQSYERLNKVKPQRIVVFRDGVSEGQFDMVLNEELHDLKKAIYEKNYRPTITVVVAQKRHLTRLFPKSQGDGGSSSNVPPGTVVDTTIVHPFQYDFYLCSHYGSLGTSKVTHYHVLWDEHNFTSDELQKLIYDLCFTVARCTKPVSLVPPVYYADLVAYRGRMYQEVMMEVQPPASEAPSSSSRASCRASFDEKFYKLHPEVENTMFFI